MHERYDLHGNPERYGCTQCTRVSYKLKELFALVPDEEKNKYMYIRRIHEEKYSDNNNVLDNYATHIIQVYIGG